VERDIRERSARTGVPDARHPWTTVVDRKFLAIEALEDELEAREESMLADVSNFIPAELLQIASGPIESPQESFPRAGDPHQDLSQRLFFYTGKGNLPLSGHL